MRRTNSEWLSRFQLLIEISTLHLISSILHPASDISLHLTLCFDISLARGTKVIVGLPKEIKDNEYRVGLTPAGVRALTDAAHQVVVEKSAGEGSGFEDALYQKAGAQIIGSADEVWSQADMIVR